MVCHPSSLSEIDMRLASTKTAAALCGGLLLALSVPASAAVDAKLLDMLKANGRSLLRSTPNCKRNWPSQKEKQIAQQAQQETNEQIAATAKKPTN
jgi:hypothetical protein